LVPPVPCSSLCRAQDDEDEDGEDEDERAVAQVMQENEEGGGTPKLRRRATLKVNSAENGVSSPHVGALAGGVGGGPPIGVWTGRRSIDAASELGARGGDREDPSMRRPYASGYEKYDKMRTLTTESTDVSNTGCCGWMGWRNRLRSALGRCVCVCRETKLSGLVSSGRVDGTSPIKPTSASMSTLRLLARWSIVRRMQCLQPA
jgi:hypothetical protein